MAGREARWDTRQLVRPGCISGRTPAKRPGPPRASHFRSAPDRPQQQSVDASRIPLAGTEILSPGFALILIERQAWVPTEIEQAFAPSLR